MTSTKIAVVGMRNSPSQNDGVVNSISAMPTNTAPTGMVGQILLYRPMKINHIRIDPQMAACVSRGQELVTKPAFKQTVTTTYYKKSGE